jgi:hypothetical protein
MERRNNSKLSFIDCSMRLIDDSKFEEMSNDDLDSIYYVAFRQWAYHMTREGYIKSLYDKRASLTIQL